MATRFTPALELFLLKIQSDNETAQTDLNSGNLIEVMSDSKFDYQNDTSEVALVSGTFDQEAAVPGKRSTDITLKVPLRPFGASDSGVAPDFGALVRVCNFEEIENEGYFKYQPISTAGVSATCWHYAGLSATTTNLQKASNLKGSAWKISGEVGKLATFETPLVGVYDSYGVGVMPTVSRNRTVVPALLSMTMVINGSAYKVISFEVDGNQDADNDIDGTDAAGGGQTNVTARKIKMTAKVYMDLQTSLDPIAALEAQTLGAVQLYWGSSSEIKIDAGYSQIVDVKRSDQNGKTTFDLSLQLNRNDFSLSVLGGNSSSSSSSSSSS